MRGPNWGSCLRTACGSLKRSRVCAKYSGTRHPPRITPEEAIRLLGEIASARPDWARGQYSLGDAYERLAEHVLARQHLANALHLDPSLRAAVEALNARMFWIEKKYVDAIAAADRSLAANPSYYLALVVRGRACSALGRMAEADECLRRSLEIVPDPTIHSSLLFNLNYLSATTPESIFQEARRWNTLYAAPLASGIQRHANRQGSLNAA